MRHHICVDFHPEDLRRMVIALERHGTKKSEVARLFGVSLSGDFRMKCERAIIGCVCLLFTGVFVVGGCAPDGEEGTDQGTKTGNEAEMTEEPIATIEVSETEYTLYPEEVVLDSPGTYVFRAVNDGNSTHALKIGGNQGSEEQVTENIAPDESAELVVNLEPGTYEFYCPVGDHKDLGMEGAITVQEG